MPTPEWVAEEGGRGRGGVINGPLATSGGEGGMEQHAAAADPEKGEGETEAAEGAMVLPHMRDIALFGPEEELEEQARPHMCNGAHPTVELSTTISGDPLRRRLGRCVPLLVPY